MSDNNVKRIKKNKKFHPRKRKNKLVIMFDEKARREFLTGFRKRKLQRKQKVKEELEEQLKAERKRIKAQAKEQYKKLLLSRKPLPELDHILSENIDMGTHSVSVTELSAADLAKKNNWIGINQVQYAKPNEEESPDTKSESEQEELEGMDLRQKKSTKVKGSKVTPLNRKELKKQIKQKATNVVKNSAVFKKKAKLERIRNLKLKKREEKLKRKQNKKHKKKS